MNKIHTDLFSLINTIQTEQEAQKLQGLNDYNMVNVVRDATHEVGMHSNIIYSLIDFNGKHYQGDLFLKLFIKHVLNISLNEFGRNLSVAAEESTEENRRIDFTIKSDKFLIGIEMKVNAKDSKNQVLDYYKQLKNEREYNQKNQTVIIYYLSKYGSHPPKKSTGSNFPCKEFPQAALTTISFKNEILKWVSLCQREVRNISNLNGSLEDYKNIVKKITDTYTGNVMTISNELTKKENEHHLLTALALDAHMTDIKAKVLHDFFNQVDKELRDHGYINISVDIFNNKRVADSEIKCKHWFKAQEGQRNKGKKTKENIGLFFDCGLKDGVMLYVMVASKALRYGLITINGENQLVDYLANQHELAKQNGLVECKDWPELPSWFSKDYAPIDELLIGQSDNELLNFKTSSLKSEIIQLVNNINSNI